MALRGWQRTWLGAPVQGERRLALGSIRNCLRDGTTVMLWVPGWVGFDRKLEFQCDSVEAAESLCARLPVAADAAFERDWRELREFHRALYADGNYPWGATTLVALNVLAFLVFVIGAKSWTGVLPQMLTLWGSNYGPLTVGGQWWRLVSSLFLHIGLMHLALNMWVLWNAGRLAERLFGHSVFLLLYFFTGIVAGLATIAWNPGLNVVGSSGAIFGIIAAVLTSVVRPSLRTPAAFVRAHWLSLLLFTMFNLAAGYLDLGVANAAHVGGFAAGAVLGAFVAYPRHDSEVRCRRRQIAAATGAAIVVLLIALAMTPGIGIPMAPTQQFWRSHQWFIAGEADNLREWQSLMIKAQSGNISDNGLAQAFESEILPFWKSAVERTIPAASLPADEQDVARAVNDYAVARRDWARTVVDAVRSGSGASASNLQYYLEKVNKLTAQLERRASEENADLASHALVRSTLVARVRRTLLPTPACVRSPLHGHSTNAGDLATDGPKRRESIGCVAQSAFRSGDFDALEGLFTKYPAGYSDPADGGSDRYSLLAGLDDLFEYGGMPIDESLIGIAGWRRRYPHSILPAIVEASAFSDWGWLARGTGYAASVTQQQLQAFAHRNAMAEGVLEDIRDRSEDEPLWYVLAVNVRLNLGETQGDIRSAFDDGIGKFPDFLPLYRAVLRTLMPRWGGSFEKVNSIIEHAAAGRDPAAGAQMYARLYWAYASLEGDEVDLFADSKAEWARMIGGFDLLIKRYPDSDYLLSGYAYMACRAHDAATFHALETPVRNKLSSTAWTDAYSFAACEKQFAGHGG